MPWRTGAMENWHCVGPTWTSLCVLPLCLFWLCILHTEWSSGRTCTDKLAAVPCWHAFPCLSLNQQSILMCSASVFCTQSEVQVGPAQTSWQLYLSSATWLTCFPVLESKPAVNSHVFRLCILHTEWSSGRTCTDTFLLLPAWDTPRCWISCETHQEVVQVSHFTTSSSLQDPWPCCGAQGSMPLKLGPAQPCTLAAKGPNLNTSSGMHLGKSATIRESNHGLGVCKEHYAKYYVPKSSIWLARTGVWKINSVACGFSSIKIDYSDYPKSLISRINDVYVRPKKKIGVFTVCQPTLFYSCRPYHFFSENKKNETVFRSCLSGPGF